MFYVKDTWNDLVSFIAHYINKLLLLYYYSYLVSSPSWDLNPFLLETF